MRSIKQLILGVSLLAVLGCSVCRADTGAIETPAQKDARMAWFKDARFGMFIHWGVYSVPAGEYNGKKGYAEWILEETKMPLSQYVKFADQFTADKFDARAIVKLAKDAGMKYLVITSKHHDGFCLFDSKVDDWNITHTPAKRDVLKELKEACDEAGLKFCLYHSIMDWHDERYTPRRDYNDLAKGNPDMDRFVNEKLKPQLKEIIEKYQPGILWFDGEWEGSWTTARGEDLEKYCRSLKPDVIINNRVGHGRNGMVGMNKAGQMAGDYGTPEQQIPANGFGPGVYWESCMTINNHWGYNKNDQNWKSTKTIVRNLVDISSKGGNYLLNVGPTSEGLIPDGSIQRLQELAKWMAVNGEAIHGTDAGPFKRVFNWGRCTQKGNKLYFSVFDWPTDGKLLIPMTSKIIRSYLLAKPDQTITTENTSEGAVLTLPAAAPDEIASVIVAEIQGAPVVLEQIPTQATDGTIKLLAMDGVVVGQDAKMEDTHIGYWTNLEDVVNWTVQIDRPGKFTVELDYALVNGVSEFEITTGDKKLSARITDTGSWQKFKNTSVGELEVTQKGKVTLTVKGISKTADGLMNLRSVILSPVK